MKKNVFLIFTAILIGLFTGCSNDISATLDNDADITSNRGVVSDGYVILYEHAYYSGRQEVIYDAAHLQSIVKLNNIASSMKVFGNIKVQLSNYANLGGIYTRWITEDVPNFVDIAFNDIATGLCIIDKSEAKSYVSVTLRETAGVGSSGGNWDLYPGKVYDLGKYKNTLSEIYVIGHYIVTLYAADGSFTQVFSGSTKLYNIAFDNKAVSISIDSPKSKYAVIFDSKDYGGSSNGFLKNYVVVSKNNTKLSTLNFDNKLSSVQVFNLGGSPMKFYHSVNKTYSSSVHSRFPYYRPIGNSRGGNATFGNYGYDNKVSLVAF